MVIYQGNAQGDSEQVEEIVIARGYYQDLKEYLHGGSTKHSSKNSGGVVYCVQCVCEY